MDRHEHRLVALHSYSTGLYGSGHWRRQPVGSLDFTSNPIYNCREIDFRKFTWLTNTCLAPELFTQLCLAPLGLWPFGLARAWCAAQICSAELRATPIVSPAKHVLTDAFTITQTTLGHQMSRAILLKDFWRPDSKDTMFEWQYL